jgi:putative membrane protein
VTLKPPTVDASGVGHDDCSPRSGWRWFQWVVLGIVVSVAGFLVLEWVLGGTPHGPPGGPYPFFWPFFPLGFFLVLLLVFLVFRGFWWGYGWRGRGWGDYHQGARSILEERYARGELTRDQFLLMSRDLDQPPIRNG